MQLDNLMPQQEISRRVGPSAPAVARRLQTASLHRIIKKKDISVVNERAIGRPLTVIAEVTTETGKTGSDRRDKKAFRELSTGAAVLLHHWRDGLCAYHECQRHG